MYFIVGNTLVNKRFYALPIKMLQVVNKCCRSSPQFYKLSINVVGHLHLVLATGLEFLLFPPSQLEGRFSGLNCCHHCHYWNLCCHLVFYGHSCSAFLGFFWPRKSCHNYHISHWHVLSYAFPASWDLDKKLAFQSIFQLCTWTFRYRPSCASFFRDLPDKLSQLFCKNILHSGIVFHLSGSHNANFHAGLAFPQSVWLCHILCTPTVFLSSHHEQFHVSDDRSKSKLLMANRTIHLEWGGHVASMT